MAAVVDLGRLSRFETTETLAKIGAWTAVRNPQMLLNDAFARVGIVGVLPLLCVLDAVLKFSAASERDVAEHVPKWLARAARVITPAYYNAAEELVLSWIAHGVVAPICAAALAAAKPAMGGGRVHACRVCRIRFSHPWDCARHAKLHSDAQTRACASLALQQATSLGLFVEFDEKRKTVAALKMARPRRACSPVSIRETDARTCPHCGDRFTKTFSDVHNDFMWENVSRDAAGSLLHDECATSFF